MSSTTMVGLAPPSSLERCARAGLFALRFASDDARAKSVVVATDGNGVGAPSACGMLGVDGVVTRLRREGVRLHVLDYGGGLDAQVAAAARAGRDGQGSKSHKGRVEGAFEDDGLDDGRTTDGLAGDLASDDGCWGLAPDWASVALVCDRAAGTLLAYDVANGAGKG